MFVMRKLRNRICVFAGYINLFGVRCKSYLVLHRFMLYVSEDRKIYGIEYFKF